MRVLLLHNRYRAPGGEERAVADIATLLERRGHQVRLLERSSAAVGRWRAGASMLAGGLDPGAVVGAVEEFGADVLHAHNVHPLFGWRALAAAHARGARTVFHVHNFRLFCAIAVAYRDGAPCFRCRGRNTWPGLRLRCRGSLPEATAYAIALRNQQPRLFEHVDRFVVLSNRHGGRLAELGLPAERAVTLPNFIADSDFAEASRAGEGRYALVSGRLVPEKGFDTAIVAARAAGVPLVVTGEGPDEQRLRALAGDADVRFTGRVPPQEMPAIRAQAAVVLVPSRCEEACPYALLDALAGGVPVLVSDRGGLPELAGPRATVAAEDQNAWAEALGALWRDRELRTSVGNELLENARRRFSEQTYYNALLEAYGWEPRPSSNQSERSFQS